MPTRLNTEPYLEAIASDLREAIVRNGHSTTGEAERSVKVRNKRNVIAKGYVSTLFQGVGRRPTPGRLPNMYNIEKLIIDKPIQFADPSGRPQTSTQMAFAIGKTIANRGTRIFRDRRRGIQVKRIIENNNRIYMPRIARDLKNTYVDAFNISIIT